VISEAAESNGPTAQPGRASPTSKTTLFLQLAGIQHYTVRY
jgi:hypothetical protein